MVWGCKAFMHSAADLNLHPYKQFYIFPILFSFRQTKYIQDISFMYPGHKITLSKFQFNRMHFVLPSTATVDKQANTHTHKKKRDEGQNKVKAT